MDVLLKGPGNVKRRPPREDKPKIEREAVQKLFATKGFSMTKTDSFYPRDEQPEADVTKILKVYPDEIYFKDIKVNQTYEINVMVRNLTKTARRIRIMQPKAVSKFRVDYDMAGMLAPGLAIELVVSFSSTMAEVIHDAIEIISNGDKGEVKCTIPLHAYPPQASIIFEPFINLGFIPLNAERRHKVKFKNEGSVDGKVDLRFTDLPDFRIEPQPNFKVKAGKTSEVDFVYTPREAGIFRGIIEVHLEGQSFLNHIDVNATSVEFLKFIVDTDGNEMSKVEFGEVFFGQRREIKGYLVNNSPKPFKFKVSFIHGLHKDYDEKNNLRTPIEEGIQQTQRVMSVVPSEGVIDTYSQIPINFYCSSKIQDDHLIWVSNNSFKRAKPEKKPDPKANKRLQQQFEANELEDKCTESHEYTALFNFDENSDSKLLMMTAKCICPRVFFGEVRNFDFGKIMVNEFRSLKLDVSNGHPDLEVDVEFPNVSTFYVVPQALHLAAGEMKTVEIFFHPKNLGKFLRTVQFLINKKFPVDIILSGQASQIGDKSRKLTGPLKIDFENYDEKFYVDKINGNLSPEEIVREEERIREEKRKKLGKTAMSKTNYHFKPNDRLLRVAETTEEAKLPLISDNVDTFDNYDNNQMLKHSANQANDYLTTMRNERELKKKRGYIVSQNKVRGERIKTHLGKMAQTAADSLYSGQGRQDQLDSPRLTLPTNIDTLFVMKPIGHYEPYPMYNFSQHFASDFVNPNPYPELPMTHAESRDVESVLTGEELQKVQVGPVKIDFGSIFIKSTDSRHFQIKNDLRKPISVQLNIEGNKELEDSYTKKQIIPSGKTASFKVCFFSFVEQQFERTITYKINDQHLFKLLVVAQVTAVILTLKKNEEEFIFDEETLDMKLTKEVVVVNNGNAAASYYWAESKTGCFSVLPPQGEVQSKSSATVRVTYAPSGTKLIEEEELIMKVVDGPYRTLLCKSVLNEVKCEFSANHLDFGIMCVSEKKTLTTLLQNKISKTFAVFAVDQTNLAATGLEINPLRERIPPDESTKFEITYCSLKPTRLENKEVKINLRGAQPAILTISATTIIPDVRIKEEEFNFGEVTFGNTESLKMTLVNESQIDIILTMDLREDENKPETEVFARLDIKYLGENDADDDQVLEEKDLEDIKPEFNRLKDMKKEELLDESNEEEQVEKEVAATGHSRYYVIRLKKKKTYEFELKFSPKHQMAYKFNLPISLAGFERIESLNRKVYCQGITPKLIMEPMNGELQFDKKIITSMDAVSPQPLNITFTNSHNSKPLPFRIDTSALKRRDIFTVTLTQGLIEPQNPVTIKIHFKPAGSEKYEDELPLYIDDEPKPYTMIRLRGEGAYPKLLFDRREVILPVVPLNVESKCTFKIENEGYQNLILQHYLTQDIGAFNLKVDLPDGKTLGSSTNQLRVEVSFVSAKPISFTTKLVFQDESKNTYPIFVSGTADNCLLTNFPHFQVHGEDFKLTADNNKPIRIESNDNDVNSETTPNPDGQQGSKPGTSNLSIRSNFGFAPIPLSQLEKSCSFCKGWLNAYVLSTDIESFPGDVVSSNGQQVFEMIAFLTKKTPLQMSKIDASAKKMAKIEFMHTQYKNLLHFLKENGAMLNTIRPEYLLSHHDLLAFYKRNPNPCATYAANKISERHHKYLSMDAWVTLFFQILKVYYLCRINLKAFKSMKELPTDRPLIPDGYIEQSQVYSQPEVILLRWGELAYEKIYPSNSKIRLVNFDDDWKNGLVLGSLLQMYIGNTAKKLFSLKTTINSQEDMKNNFEKIKHSLVEYGISKPPDFHELGKVAGREVLVYLVHLFQLLPYFLPKATLDFPVMLKGSCVRNVMLNNPSNKKIFYGVKLDGGGGDFTIEKDSVEIESKQTIPFAIKYTARISKQITARVTFKNKRETGAQATPLVFDLKSEVQGRYSEEVIKVQEEVPLYSMYKIEVIVPNSYSQSVNFNIRIENEPVIIEDPKKKKPPLKKGAKEEERVFLPAFFCKSDTVSIAKNGTGKVNIFYLPCTLEPHKCFIIFTDEKVGEMQFEVQGEPQPPPPLDSKPTKFVCNLDNMEVQYLPISRKNPAMDNAMTKLKDMIRDSKSITNKSDLLKKVESLKENLQFFLECDQPFVQTPILFTLIPQKKPDGPDNKFDRSGLDELSLTDHANRLPLNLAYKFPVPSQLCTILMRNSTRTDVRIYHVDVTVMPKKVKALLEMTTPARIPLHQNIPIINTLDSDVQIKLNLEKIKNGDAFKLPFSDQHVFKVSSKEPYQLRLTFDPEWTYDAMAKLTLFNKETNEHFEYDLRGVGEEPLAEKEYVVECKLKEEKTIFIELENVKRASLQYSVEIDLPYATGAATLEVSPGKPIRYPLRVSPLLGGEFTGSVTLKNDLGHYWWFMVTLKVESSKFERHLELISHCRRPITQEIELENPINEPITFKVAIENDSLSGNPSVVVGAKSKAKYLLTFLPLSEFREKTMVTFLNQRIGDIIYDILLVSDAAPIIKIGPIRCEVGKSERATIKLENVIKEQALAIARAIDSPNFYLNAESVYIPGNGSAEVEIVYIPSDLEKQDSAVLVFDSKEVGSWTFKMLGMGIPPTKYPQTAISGSLGKQSTNSVSFKNPFREPISVSLQLETDEASKEIFELVMKKSKLNIAAQQTIDINYNFFPREITDYSAELVVQMNDKVAWRYPIAAYTESVNNDRDIRFITKCHEKLEKREVFELPGITNINPNEDFEIQVVLNSKEVNPIMHRWLVCEPEVKRISQAHEQLRFNFKFTPHKPFKSYGEVIIMKPSGGRWR